MSTTLCRQDIVGVSEPRHEAVQGGKLKVRAKRQQNHELPMINILGEIASAFRFAAPAPLRPLTTVRPHLMFSHAEDPTLSGGWSPSGCDLVDGSRE